MIDKMDRTIPIILFTTTILLILSIGNLTNFADAVITISCPQISNWKLSDNDLSQQEFYARYECNYVGSDQVIKGYLVANYVKNSQAAVGVNECSGKLEETFYGGQMWSTSHRINIIYEYNNDNDYNLMTSGAKSLLQQLETKNVAISCKTEIQKQADSTGTTSQEPNNQSVPRYENTASDIALIFLFLFILFVLPIIILVWIIKKIRGRRKRKREKAKQIEEENAKEELTTETKKKVSIKGGYALNPLTGNYGVTKAQLRSNESNPRVGDYGKDVRKNEDGSPKWHSGLDLQAKVGTPVFSADGGTVIEAGEMGDDRGTVVTIDHGGGWKTHYWHLKEELVNVGQKVDPGQLIGETGMTGNAKYLKVDEAHLHFEVRVDGVSNSPWNVFNEPPG